MPTAALELDSLSKTYGATRAVADLSLRVEAGQVFGYLGPNGAGKTTTIRLALGLQRPTGGRAAVLGLDAQTDSVEIHRRVGYLPGELALYPRLSGRRHLEWFAHARGVHDRALATELCERFQVTLDRPARELSKGNRQKLGLVLAFMHRPELLILDEPTSSLDPLMQEEFERLVRETVAEGKTVFLSSHELDEVQRLADRVAIIRSGRLVATDTVEHLRASTPLRVEARFRAPVDPARFAQLEGVTVTSRDGDRLVLQVAGPLAPVLVAIAEHDPVDVLTEVARLDVLLRRRSLLGYSLGMAVYTLVVVALYPAFKNSNSLDKLIKDDATVSALFGVNGPISTSGGWLNGNLYANFLPLVMLLLTVGYGAASLAGQDEDGTLCLVTTLPIRRTAIVLQKVVAMALQAVVLAAAVAACVLVGHAFELTTGLGEVVSISATTLLLGLDFGLVTMAIGAYTGSRSTALGLGTAFAAASYLLGSLAPVVSWLHPGRYASLFYWSVANDQITAGARLADYAVLIAFAVLALWAVTAAFRRLDLH
jgi:beta-exotoxin I transport system ATP-binding protein